MSGTDWGQQCHLGWVPWAWTGTPLGLSPISPLRSLLPYPMRRANKLPPKSSETCTYGVVLGPWSQALFPRGWPGKRWSPLAGVVCLLWDHTTVGHQNGADKLILRDSNISWTQTKFRTLDHQWSLLTLGLECICRRLSPTHIPLALLLLVNSTWGWQGQQHVSLTLGAGGELPHPFAGSTPCGGIVGCSCFL